MPSSATPKASKARSTAIRPHPDSKAAPGGLREKSSSATRPDIRKAPRILFFSGGTALRETSRILAGYTPHTIHLVTPFDSGGSSAVLRRYFHMPAVGDMRSRFMALADCSRPGISEICNVLSRRLAWTCGQKELRTELVAFARGEHPLMAAVADAPRALIGRLLHVFLDAGPEFDLRGASLGNLVLTAAYLENGRKMRPAAAIYAELVAARGEVGLILDCDLHLLGILENGRRILGQHLLTGKETPPLTSPLRELHLASPADPARSMRPPVALSVRNRIRSAHLICYPVGSFYSSLVANLLPAGVGRAVSGAAAPKVFIPNTFHDPESIGLSLKEQISVLVRHLQADAPRAIAVRDVLRYVLLDPAIEYPGHDYPERELASQGIRTIFTPLTDPRTKAIDPHLLCRALLELV